MEDAGMIPSGFSLATRMQTIPAPTLVNDEVVEAVPAPDPVSDQARLIMEASHDAMLMIDQRLRIIAWNHAAEATFGWTAEEALGRDAVELMVPERLRGTYRIGLPAAMAPTADLPALRNLFETVAVGSDGEEFPIELSLRALSDGDGGLLVACIRDLSNRREASAQLVAGETHTRFVANLSHELRTPLNSVLGFAQLLTRDAQLTERQRRYVGHIMEGGGHLLELFDTILDLERIGTGQADLQPERLPLRQLLDATIQSLGPVAAEAGVQVHLALETETEVRSDRRRLTQIITNVISNAIKFTPDGGQVTVTATASGGAVEIGVTDTGMGIPLADQERIFDAFAQVDSGLSRRHQGTGLGLSVSRRLAVLLGGELRVSSVVGVGSTFSLILPGQGGM
jgi:two-component system, sensor histidine kinase and response regulator